MSVTVQSLLDDVAAEGAFDATSAQVLRWLDRRHKIMVARSKCIRETRMLSGAVTVTVVAGITRVPVPDIVELYEILYISPTGSVATFARARHADFAAYAQSQLLWAGADGLFYREGTEVSLFPSVDVAGQIQVEGAWAAADLTALASVSVDDEAVEGLLAGVFATALSRPNEARMDLAAGYEQQFAGACEELRQRTQYRLKGRGTGTIRMAPGYGARV